MPLYDHIGQTYDHTRRADPAIVARLREHLCPSPEQVYLDLACGTGNYTVALAQSDVALWGLDASETMLNALRQKAPELILHQGIAEALPFEDQTFGGAVCTLAIHHFEDLPKAFAEVYRVLKPGRFVIFSAGRQQMRGYWLNEYFPQALEDSIAQMPSLKHVQSVLTQAGFAHVRVDPFFIDEHLQDLFLYSGKQRPELYFDEKVRAGISTFSALANAAEVNAGLKRLSHDLESGRFAQVKASYENDLGDYAFVVAQKR